MGYTFYTESRPDDWDDLVDLPNPPQVALQHLRGISEEMNPSALNRPASFVEEKIGTLIKTFQRTISAEVGNAGPEHCRTKKALVLSMRKIQSLLRDPPSALSTVDLRCFAQDRFRAVRQELEQQHIRSRLAVRMLEEMVRYSIMTVHEMCQAPDYSAPLGIDKNEVSKMLMSLQQMYQEHRQAGDALETEAEFTSYAILLKAGQDLGGSVSLSLAASLVSIHDDMLNKPCVKWSLEISRYARERNPARFFGLCEDSTYVQACFVHMQFLEVMRQAQAGMLFQRKNSFAVQELREYLLLDSDQDVITWLTSYELPYEQDNGKLMLDKLPSLAGRGPGADVSQRFIQKAQGKSLGDMISSQLSWPKTGHAQAPGLWAGSRHTFTPFPDQRFKQKTSLQPDSMQPSGITQHIQAAGPPAGFPVSRVAGQPGLRGLGPGPAGAELPRPGHVQHAAAASVHADAVADQAAAGATEKLIAQRVAAERAAAARAADEQAMAAHEAAVAAAKLETARREHQEQEAMAIAAREAAQKRAEAEAIRAADRMAKMKLDAEYVRAGEVVSRKEREAWDEAEEQYHLMVAEAERQRAEVARLRQQQAAMEAEAEAQKQREEHAAWYQRIAEAQGALKPQLEESCMEALQLREEYRTVKGCVLQSLLLMKAVGGRHGIATGGALVEATTPAAQLAGSMPAPGNDEAAVRIAAESYGPSDTTVFNASGPTARLGHKSAATSPAWHDNQVVMTARICARSRNNTEDTPSAYISKLLGTRRFKSVKSRPRW